MAETRPLDSPLSQSLLTPTPHVSAPSTSSAKRQSCKQLLVSYIPILGWLPRYDWRYSLQRDLVCGVTLGCVLLGQSLAHANLSGVPVVHGPYSCLLPPVVYAIFGTCSQGSVGTGGLLALLTGIQLHDLPPHERAHAATILCLIVGAILALMGILQLSFLVRFLSRSALSGFITGSAILIMKAMLVPMLGLPKAIEREKLFKILQQPSNFERCNIAAVGLSLAVILFLASAKKVLPSFLKDFKELIALAAAGALVFCRPDLHIEVVGNAPEGLPGFALPLTTMDDVQLAQDLLPGGALIAVVTFISSFASAKKCALTGGYRVVALNELLALGLANVSGAFFGAVPTQIGLSRSALASGMGVQTCLGSNVFVACSIAGILMAFSPLLVYIPHCVLNAIIFVAAIGLLEFEQARKLYSYHDRWDQRKDLMTWLVAFVGTLAFGAFEGILAAVAISLYLAIKKVVNPNMDILGKMPEGAGRVQWVSIERHPEAVQTPGVLVVRIDGPMFYANSERFQDQVDELEVEYAAKSEPLRAIILNAISISFVDDTAVQVLTEMLRSWRARGIKFYIARAHGSARLFFQRTLIQDLRQDDLQLTTDQCIELFQKETARERALEEEAGKPAKVARTKMRRQSSILPMPSVQP